MTKIMSNIQLGSDFELFIFNKNQQKYINAKPYVRGNKRKPFNFDKSNKFWRTCLDNVLMEGNIKPSTDFIDFYSGIVKVMDYMKSILPIDHELHPIPAVYMPEEELNTEESVEIGCEVDYNAYTLAPNPKPCFTSTLRSAAFHIHVSYDNMTPLTSIEWIKAMDMFLGLPSLLIEPENERRTLYGNPGAYRISRITTEYRVLSNYFLSEEKLTKWVFDNTLKAIDYINENKEVPSQISDQVLQLFSSKDKEEIKNFIQQNNIPLPI